MNVLVAGDFFVSNYFKNKELIGACVAELFASADLRIINHEAPITERGDDSKIAKTGPHLKTHPDTAIPYLEKLGIHVATLANNHILDYGNDALNDTFEALEKAGIGHVGAGKDFLEASQFFSTENNELKVAVLNFAENEWSTTDNAMPGANPLDIIENVKQIKKAKSDHDKVVCIIHGGHEYYPLPSPRMQKTYRFYVDNGADAIVCHHAHCMSGYEVYESSPIIYGLGNFLFTISSPHEEWYRGLVVNLIVMKNEPITFDLIPVKQDDKTFKVSLVGDERERASINNFIDDLSRKIQNPETLYCEWNKFVNSRKNAYQSFLSPLSGVKPGYLKALLFRSGVYSYFISDRQKLLMLNILRCESHKDLMQASLDEKKK